MLATTEPADPASAQESRLDPEYCDWSVFTVEGVPGVVESVARKAAGRYGFVEPVDMLQEVRLILSTTPALVEAARTEPPGVLWTRLWRDVSDAFKGSAETQAKREATWTSLDDADDHGWSWAGDRLDHQQYAAWHAAEHSSPLAALGVREYPIEQRLVIGLHHYLNDSDSDGAWRWMLYDARVAWSRANLTHRHRRAVVLIVGRGLSRVDAARVAGLHESTMRRRFDRALELMVAEVESWTSSAA